MEDHLVRVISECGKIRGLACVTTALSIEACKRHSASPTASVALSRALSVGALMGALMKGDQRVALKFEGNGALKKVFVEANGKGDVRGYVGGADAIIPLTNGKIDVAKGIGNAGLLTVAKDLNLKKPYSGRVHLVSGEIGEDVAYYLSESEQIPSAVGLGAYVNSAGVMESAGGFLIQAMPPSREANLESIVAMINTLGPLSQQFRNGKKPIEILHHLFAEVPHATLETFPLRFRCWCSRQRVESALYSIGLDELQKMLEEDNGAEASCEFCNNKFVFDSTDLSRIIDSINNNKS